MDINHSEYGHKLWTMDTNYGLWTLTNYGLWVLTMLKKETKYGLWTLTILPINIDYTY